MKSQSPGLSPESFNLSQFSFEEIALVLCARMVNSSPQYDLEVPLPDEDVPKSVSDAELMKHIRQLIDVEDEVSRLQTWQTFLYGPAGTEVCRIIDDRIRELQETEARMSGIQFETHAVLRQDAP